MVTQILDAGTKRAKAHGLGFITYLNYLTMKHRYGSSAPKPYELISVDPAEINYICDPELNSQVSEHGTHVVGGDWDEFDESDDPWILTDGKNKRYDTYIFHRSLKDHFCHNVPWSETKLYRLVETGKYESGHYQDVEALHNRLSEIEQLFERMNERGYQTQRELADQGNVPFGTATWPCPEHHEVTVNIARNGELIRDEGRHRLSVAKILGIKTIPVRVLVRHKEWQRKRQRIASNDIPATINLDHPDLTDVL